MNGYWPETLLANNEIDEKIFKKECKRLYKQGVPRSLIDVLGDGNCLYYCMLNYLLEVDQKIDLTMTQDYPLVWIRKLIRAGALSISEQYWRCIDGNEVKERIDFLHNPEFNTMDDELTRLPANVDHQGDLMGAVIFASIFHLRVVIYQASAPAMTYYVDGRNFNKDTGMGILFANFEGIVPTKVPRGRDVFTVVQYQTDDDDLGVGKEPEHWVRLVTSKKENGYEPSNKNFNPIDLAIDGQTDLSPEEIASRRPKESNEPKPGTLVGPLREGKVILKDGRLTKPPAGPQGDPKHKKSETSEVEGMSPSKNKSANEMDSLPSEEEADDHPSD